MCAMSSSLIDILEIAIPVVVVGVCIAAFRFYVWWIKSQCVRNTRRLAKQGDPEGLNGMGIYCQEKGDHAQAVEYFSRAAERGHAEAKALLGHCYLVGEGVEPSLPRALDLFRAAAEEGSEYGQLYLAECYEDGQGVTPDAHEAVRLYELSAAQDCSDAQYKLGMCYLRGIGVEADKDRAIELLQRAAYKLQGDAARELDELGLPYKTLLDDDEQ